MIPWGSIILLLILPLTGILFSLYSKKFVGMSDEEIDTEYLRVRKDREAQKAERRDREAETVATKISETNEHFNQELMEKCENIIKETIIKTTSNEKEAVQEIIEQYEKSIEKINKSSAEDKTKFSEIVSNLEVAIKHQRQEIENLEDTINRQNERLQNILSKTALQLHEHATNPIHVSAAEGMPGDIISGDQIHSRITLIKDNGENEEIDNIEDKISMIKKIVSKVTSINNNVYITLSEDDTTVMKIQIDQADTVTLFSSSE